MRGLEPGALCYGEGDRRAGKSQAGGRAPWCHDLLTFVMPQDGLGGRSGQQAHAIQLFFSSGFFPPCSFSKVHHCPGQSTCGSAGVTCATAFLSIHPKSQEDFFEAFCGASLAPGHVMSPE